MTPSSETEIFLGGGSNGKNVAPGIVFICSIDKNRDHYTKNWLLAPNIQILGSKKHIFAPSGQLEPHRSMFSTRKRCLIGLPIWGYQNFYSLPPKNWILIKKGKSLRPALDSKRDVTAFSILRPWNVQVGRNDKYHVCIQIPLLSHCHQSVRQIHIFPLY